MVGVASRVSRFFLAWAGSVVKQKGPQLGHGPSPKPIAYTRQATRTLSGRNLAPRTGAGSTRISLTTSSRTARRCWIVASAHQTLTASRQPIQDPARPGHPRPEPVDPRFQLPPVVQDLRPAEQPMLVVVHAQLAECLLRLRQILDGLGAVGVLSVLVPQRLLELLRVEPSHRRIPDQRLQRLRNDRQAAPVEPWLLRALIAPCPVVLRMAPEDPAAPSAPDQSAQHIHPRSWLDPLRKRPQRLERVPTQDRLLLSLPDHLASVASQPSHPRRLDDLCEIPGPELATSNRLQPFRGQINRDAVP